ncbi:MAG: hypothetical protein JNG88_04630 [Phycisphaerales bacterium]|nr:hypothetical protein [Phycisphaerales bacterium]
MSEAIRVIVVNADEEAAPELRACLLGIDGVKIVAEIEEIGLLEQALRQFPADALILHLDPAPQPMMEVVCPLVETNKDRIAAIAMTEDRDAELVVRAMRAGMKEFLWKPFPPEQLAEILRRVRTEGPNQNAKVGKLVPVVGTGGGVGATSLATNLAVELAQLTSAGSAGAKPRVAIADLDLRYGQVAMFLDSRPTYSISDLCETPETIEPEMIARVMFKHPTGVHILAHPSDPAQAERISAAHCAAVLGALQANYDFVVIDGPSRIDHTARVVFDMTDTFLVVTQLLVPTVRNTDRMLHELTRAGFNMDRLRLVCNRYGRDAGHLDIDDAEATLGRRIDFVIPEDWKAASTAINMGASLLDHAPKSKLRLAYQRIAKVLAGNESDDDDGGNPSPNGRPPKKGLFSFIGGS